jgi:hypothetical protein
VVDGKKKERLTQRFTEILQRMSNGSLFSAAPQVREGVLINEFFSLQIINRDALTEMMII